MAKHSQEEFEKLLAKRLPKPGKMISQNWIIGQLEELAKEIFDRCKNTTFGTKEDGEEGRWGHGYDPIGPDNDHLPPEQCHAGPVFELINRIEADNE